MWNFSEIQSHLSCKPSLSVTCETFACKVCLPFLALLLGSSYCNLCGAQMSSPGVQGSFLLLIDEDKLQWRLAVLFTETCNRNREQPLGKNWAEPLGHTAGPGAAAANKSLSKQSHVLSSYGLLFFLYCTDHVHLAIKRLWYLHIMDKAGLNNF